MLWKFWTTFLWSYYGKRSRCAFGNVFHNMIDSIAASLFENDWLSWQIVPDDKIQTSLLLLWRGALTNMNIVFIGGKACFVGLFLILFLLARSHAKYLVAQQDEIYISQPRHQRNIAQH